jgi:hypothetical protein
MDPAPVTIVARWPAHRRLVTDLALGCAALGTMLGYALIGRTGLTGLLLGGVLGTLIGLLVGPRRYHLILASDGVSIGRLAGTVHIPWNDVGAVGIEDGWQGRRGVTTALAIGRRGDDWPIVVPALAYHASGFRIGGQRPEDLLADHRAGLLPAVTAWADARGVPIIPVDLDDWWDRNRDRLGAT